MSWNNQKVEDLKKLWNEGVATSQIGVQLGFTKNAVIGKAFRLGLERRQNSRKKSTQNQQFSSVTMYRETSNSSSQNTVRKEPVRRREKFSFKKVLLALETLNLVNGQLAIHLKRDFTIVVVKIFQQNHIVLNIIKKLIMLMKNI